VTNRKPPGTSWESWIDAIIREGREQGEFDDLPGNGKPIEGLDKPHDELWWVRKKLKAEGVSYLPPTLALRKDREDTLAAIEALRTEAQVRAALEELNERIRTVNRRPGEGPPSTLMPLDIDEVVSGWKERHVTTSPSAEVASGDTNPATAPSSPARARWFRMGRRRRSNLG
jgi:hypothetical protein